MPGVIDFMDDDVGAGTSTNITSALLGGKASGSSRGKGAFKVNKDEEQEDDDDDDDGDGDAAFISAAISKQNKRAGTEAVKKATASRTKGKNKEASGTLSGGGSFQSMGLHPSLLRSLILRGFTTPTPVQRQAIPAILEQPPRDVVGMARTGSGKTLAYVVPLIQRLKGRHSATVGVKSLILCPSRELALQILKVGKEIARGWKADEGGEAIRWALIVGGEGMDEQFALMATNPDVVIATPGRLLHLAVEMNLDLRSVQYVVFDEADRLFEMGFATQLEEILHRLPPSRQTLLFSATLPKSLVDFARAGLQDNPKLVRLDADSKISEDLRMAFFSIKPSEKEAALLLILRDVIGVPVGEQDAVRAGGEADGRERDEGWGTMKKRKRTAYGSSAAISGADELLPHQTIIFVATKHHVEYLLLLLTTAGYSCSHIYSSLDQAARGLEMKKFREGRSSLLIVTDVAARGIDLPVLEHVVNYDFPSSPRVFVHRVGRTARAGKRGFAWNLIHHSELPYLCDLQLFLARPLIASKSINTQQMEPDEPLDLHKELVIGTLPRDALDNEVEYVNESLNNANSAVAVGLPALKQVVTRAHQMYQRSQSKASQESYRRAKEMTKADEGNKWALAGSVAEESSVHDVIRRPHAYRLGQIASVNAGEAPKKSSVSADSTASARAALLAKVNGFRPGETVFEVGARGATPNALLMKDRRRVLEQKRKRGAALEAAKQGKTEADMTQSAAHVEDEQPPTAVEEEADEEDILQTFDTGPSNAQRKQKPSNGTFRDDSVYMDYEQKDAHTERGYSMRQGESFIEQAGRAQFSLAGDEATLGTQTQAPNASRWDAKKKKFVHGDGTGADNKKLIRTESGKKLPASFKSGRYEEWAKEQRLGVQRVGETEDAKVVRTARGLFERRPGGGGGGRGSGSAGAGPAAFRHKQIKPARRPDKHEHDFKKKFAKFKSRTEGDGEGSGSGSGSAKRRSGAAKSGGPGAKKGAKRATGVRRTGAKAKSELKSAGQIYKDRQSQQKRKEKNARPTRKASGGGRR